MNERANQLRAAVQLINKLSDGMVECYDVDDLDLPEGELNELFEKVLEEEEFSLYFPGEADYVQWNIADFISQATESKSISEGKLITLRTQNLAIQLVSAASEMAEAVVYHGEPLWVHTDSGVTIGVQTQCLPAAVFACQQGAYGEFYGPVSTYTVVEADFSQFKGDRTEEGERQIIDAYLFELAASHDIVFSKSHWLKVDDEPWWIEEMPDVKLRPLEGSNEGVRLFLAASQVQDPELRFFSFYKVLEHFGPTVLNLEAHESLRKKLDSPAALSPDGQLVRGILQLAKSFDQRRNERDLMKGVLTVGVDLVGLNTLVPDRLRVAVSHDTPAKTMEKYIRDLAESICATRNNVAHAKASYQLVGTECPLSDLPQFNDFMRAAAAQVIRWFNRLPEHQKVDLALDGVN